MLPARLTHGYHRSAPHVCPWWMAYTFDNPLRRLLHDPRPILDPYVKPGMTALDVGCGMGYFSLALARLVGDSGRVVSVDLQEKMLARLKARAARAGLSGRIHAQVCTPNDLRITFPVDFALAFWMVHEVPDTGGFFRQIREWLRAGRGLLIAEPKVHVSPRLFEEIVAEAEQAGLERATAPSIRWSRSVLLTRPES